MGRTLRFIVSGQMIKPDPSCDFSGLIPGTEGYLRAAFTFDKSWEGCRKAASFFRFGGGEYAKAIENGECEIPKEALEKEVFVVSVTGMKAGYKIKTGRCIVRQNGGVTFGNC